jgi:molybdopterin-containing oxidoreductase family membrane subunit
MPLLVGVFEAPNKVVDVVGRLRSRGYDQLEVYSPAPFPEVDDALLERPSRVRLWTLLGGLLGVFTGFLMTIWMSNDWQINVGGKPFVSIPPYVILGFELTILFGGVLTVVALFVHGGLPHGKFGKHDLGYSPRFSAEEFGLTVRCKERDVAEIDALLRAFEAKEVSLVEP